MAKVIHKERTSGTTVGGIDNVDFSFPLGAIGKQVICDFNSDSTDFDLSIIDGDSEVIFKRDNEKGVLNELLELPLTGNYTAQIRNATADESYVFKIIAHEI